jgi:hypothetical protein
MGGASIAQNRAILLTHALMAMTSTAVFRKK